MKKIFLSYNFTKVLNRSNKKELKNLLQSYTENTPKSVSKAQSAKTNVKKRARHSSLFGSVLSFTEYTKQTQDG